MLNLPLADLDPGTLALMIPIVGLMIPIIRMLTKHQQRMTEIIHGSAAQDALSEVDQLRREVAELKQLVLRQTLTLDSHSDALRQRPEVAIRQRLEDF